MPGPDGIVGIAGRAGIDGAAAAPEPPRSAIVTSPAAYVIETVVVVLQPVHVCWVTPKLAAPEIAIDRPAEGHGRSGRRGRAPAGRRRRRRGGRRHEPTRRQARGCCRRRRPAPPHAPHPHRAPVRTVSLPARASASWREKILAILPAQARVAGCRYRHCGSLGDRRLRNRRHDRRRLPADALGRLRARARLPPLFGSRRRRWRLPGRTPLQHLRRKQVTGPAAHWILLTAARKMLHDLLPSSGFPGSSRHKGVECSRRRS